jgi:hypothetical protein
VVSQGRPSRPLQGFATPQHSVTPSPTSRTPSQGSPDLSKRPASCSGSFLRRSLHAVSTAARCSTNQSARARRGLSTASSRALRRTPSGPCGPGSHGRLPQAWAPPRALAALPTSAFRPRFPSWGFFAPSTTQASGSASPGDWRPRLFPSSRFLTSSTVSSPHRFAATRAAAVHGFVA